MVQKLVVGPLTVKKPSNTGKVGTIGHVAPKGFGPATKAMGTQAKPAAMNPTKKLMQGSVKVLGKDIPFEQFKKVFYETAQAQYDSATASIEAMPPQIEAEMKKFGVTKEGLLKHAQQFNPKGKTK